MKKIIIAALLTACTTTAFAEPDDFAMINGKKVTINDTKKSLIQKLGKPTKDDSGYTTWTIPQNSLISVNWDGSTIANLGVTSVNPKITNNCINTAGKTLCLNKDTVNTAVAKVTRGCFDKMTIEGETTYDMFISSHNEGNWYQSKISTTGKGGIATVRNLKIDSFNFGSAVQQTDNCNY